MILLLFQKLGLDRSETNGLSGSKDNFRYPYQVNCRGFVWNITIILSNNDFFITEFQKFCRQALTFRADADSKVFKL